MAVLFTCPCQYNTNQIQINCFFMQKFKLTTEEIAKEVQRFKKERTDDLKAIKQLYQEL